MQDLQVYRFANEADVNQPTKLTKRNETAHHNSDKHQLFPLHWDQHH